MVINCSSAAALHLYGKYKKGLDEGFFEPSSRVSDTVAGRQESHSDGSLFQWVVHAVKIGRATCLIAMELNTRWVHVIHRVHKGDVNGFVERLNARLVNGIEWLGSDFSLITPEEMTRAIDRYFELHRELRFYQQTDRSVMTHIAQVSAEYRYVYQCVGEFPGDEETALEFDLRLNDSLRSRKGEPEYWKVSEKMLEYWLVTCAGRSEAETTRALNTIRDAGKTFIMSMMGHIPTEHPGQQHHNVTDLAAFTKNASTGYPADKK